jgi:hypothetical protein
VRNYLPGKGINLATCRSVAWYASVLTKGGDGTMAPLVSNERILG